MKMSREAAFYMWVTSVLLYSFLVALYLLIPVKAFFLNQLSSDHIVGTVLVFLGFGPVSFFLCRFCNASVRLISKRYLFLVWMFPFYMSVIVGLIWTLIQ